MKTNFSKQLVKPDIKKIEDADKAFGIMYAHVQSLTDTINQIVEGGLSLNRFEKNLPIAMVKTHIQSGGSTIIPGYGATILYVSDNAIVDRFAYRTVGDNSLEITVLFDDNKSHDVVFLIVNERLPS